MRLKFLLLHVAKAKLIKFEYPDPIKDLDTLFCPVDEIFASNATIRCSKSAFDGSTCRFSCPSGFELLGPGDGKDECVCADGDCDWTGSARFSGCYNVEYLFAREERRREKDLQFARLKLAGNEMDPNFGLEQAAVEDWDDVDHKFIDMSYEDLQDEFKTNEHFSHLPKSERAFARKEYQKTLRGKFRKTKKYKAYLSKNTPSLQTMQKGLPSVNPNEQCKPLEIINGRIDCKKDSKSLAKPMRFVKGSECTNTCNPGFKLRKNAPKTKKCVCRGNKGCKWIRNAQAKCIRQGQSKGNKKVGARTDDALPWCVLIDNGKKRLVRNRKCTCPLGWSTEDKCFTPIINMTEPCQFRDNFAATGEAALNCGGIRSDGFPNLNLIVPGTTTDLDLSNAGIFEFLSNVAEGAYRLEKINLSNNFIRHLPRDFFRWNQVLTTIDLSRNQIRTLRPDVIHGLTNLETLDLSNNHMSALNKKLLKDAHNLKVLDVSNNRILQLGKWGFRKMMSLKVLNFDDNLLKTVGGLTFERSHKLEDVSFAHNRISKISSNMFDKFNGVKRLNFAGNQLTFLAKSFMDQIPRLQELNMDDNLLRDLKPLVFAPSKSLQKLQMNDNKLTELPDELFTKFGCSLKAIFLRGNELTFVNQKVLQQCNGLRYLFLSDNKIAKVPPKLLQSKSKLKTVDLSRNRINQIPSGFTKQNENLENFYLNENEIESFPLDVLENNQKLKVLDLHSNQIQNITEETEKLASSNLARVNLLDLRGNKALGELAKLFHSSESWYSNTGTKHFHEHPIEAFQSHVKTMSSSGDAQRIHDIIQRRQNFEFDEPWIRNGKPNL